jgi:hypothetical protein
VKGLQPNGERAPWLRENRRNQACSSGRNARNKCSKSDWLVLDCINFNSSYEPVHVALGDLSIAVGIRVRALALVSYASRLQPRLR